MTRATPGKLLDSPWVLHSICCLLALTCCLPILWPDILPPSLRPRLSPHIGTILLSAFITSAVLMLISAVRFCLRLRNGRAVAQLCAWGLQWGIAALIFMQLAIEADVPSPYDTAHAQPIQQSGTLHNPIDKLNGPASLTIPIEPDPGNCQQLAPAPNLIKLETEHEELLSDYLNQSPRWAFAAKDDTFYTKPGHVVLVLPATGGIPGTVHANFRTIMEGEPLPDGFVRITPGSTFPPSEGTTNELPDLAVELSGKHYLLLAWRGAKHLETACRAINAALTAIDKRLQPLAENPTPEVCQRLCKGKASLLGTGPELRVCEPTTQYGIYQAEIYANPGRAGTMLLVIRDIEQGNILRLFSFPAQYSDKPDELFRHDISGATDSWLRDLNISKAATLFPEGAPFFAIKEGASHHYFGVTFEVQFSPTGSDGAVTETLLRRNYRVQAYENQRNK